MSAVRYVAIGDSFTEGVGDELPDGQVRGWADLVAQGWADSSGRAVQYANLAIRGRLAWPIVEQQLEPALALKPTHLSFNGGGNDMLRPGSDIEHLADAFTRVLRRCDEAGVSVIVLSGANPSARLPLGKLIQRRGDELSDAVLRRVEGHENALTVLNWPDTELSRPEYWAADRLHMNAAGHHRVAARVLTSLGQSAPDAWWTAPGPAGLGPSGFTYYRQFVGPWIARRVRRTSSGDGRVAKHPEFTTVTPGTSA